MIVKRLYAVTMQNGDKFGVPAEVIADNYAKYYESKRNVCDSCDALSSQKNPFLEQEIRSRFVKIV